MRRFLRRVQSPTLLAVAALVIAVSAGAPAITASAEDAVSAAQQLITGKDVKRGAVSSRHVKDRTLRVRDLAPAAVRSLADAGRERVRGHPWPNEHSGQRRRECLHAGIPCRELCLHSQPARRRRVQPRRACRLLADSSGRSAARRGVRHPAVRRHDDAYVGRMDNPRGGGHLDRFLLGCHRERLPGRGRPGGRAPGRHDQPITGSNDE